MEFDSTRPIWQQLIDEFTRRIVTGQWASGEKTPSVRELAVEVGANPNTVQRALTELDRQKLTVSEKTAGRFVTQDLDAIAQARTGQAHSMVSDFVDGMKGLHLTHNQVNELIDTVWNRVDLSHQKGDGDNA